MVQLLKNEGARVAVVGTRDYRLELAKDLGADFTFKAADGEIAEQVQAANDGALADRAIVATGSMDANQEALAVTGPGSTVVYMGVTAPDAAVSVPMLTSLIQDKTIRFSLWYPLPVADDDPAAVGREGRHRQDHHAHRRSRRHRRSDRAGREPRRRRDQDADHAVTLEGRSRS